jgi:hypothetical protein
MPNLRALRNAGKPISTGPFAMLASSNHPLDCLKSQIKRNTTAFANKKRAAVAGGSKVNREASNRVDRSHSQSRVGQSQ